MPQCKRRWARTTTNVDGGGAQGFPHHGLTDVGRDEQRDTRSQTVALLEQLILGEGGDMQLSDTDTSLTPHRWGEEDCESRNTSYQEQTHDPGNDELRHQQGRNDKSNFTNIAIHAGAHVQGSLHHTHGQRQHWREGRVQTNRIGRIETMLVPLAPPPMPGPRKYTNK